MSCITLYLYIATMMLTIKIINISILYYCYTHIVFYCALSIIIATPFYFIQEHHIYLLSNVLTSISVYNILLFVYNILLFVYTNNEFYYCESIV